jgi:ABC-type glycerol-3-phosphate transport system permease component
MAAAGVVALVVPLLLLILGRRYILTGLTFGVVHEK